MTTNEYYVTHRLEASKPEATLAQDNEARDFIESEITRLAVDGHMQIIRTLKSRLATKFGRCYSSYHVEKLLKHLGFTYAKAQQDCSIGMRSAQGQRQLMIHLNSMLRLAYPTILTICT